MPISDWFKAREQRRYTAPSEPSRGSEALADGVWVRCEGCKRTLYARELERTLGVCPSCGRHHQLTADLRVAMLCDPDTFSETDGDLRSLDPLEFRSGTPYAEAVASAREKTGLAEAVLTGHALMGGRPVVLGAMDFRFIGASMGSVVGERITRAFETARGERAPLVLAIASGGARMQEGMLSLMQMAKTSAAAARLAEARVPYVAILTDPTMGGVTASFATLADVIVAEPGARIGFAGPRLVEQTIRRSLPKGFQSAESLLGHGMIDLVVDRGSLREVVVDLLGYLAADGE